MQSTVQEEMLATDTAARERKAFLLYFRELSERMRYVLVSRVPERATP